MEKEPRILKQDYKKEVGSSSASCLNYDLFQNEETTSFLSTSFCVKDSERNDCQKQTNTSGILDITVEGIQTDENKTKIKILPLIYLVVSSFTLIEGILSSFVTSDSSFPLFLDLPFHKAHIFQVIQHIELKIGVVVTCFFGILNYLIAYSVWKQSTDSQNGILGLNCAIGIISQIFLIAFLVIPSSILEKKSLGQKESILINLYFAFSLLYQLTYISELKKNVPKLVKMTYTYQIRVASFVLSSIVSSFYLAGIVLDSQNLFPSKEILGNSNSICAFILFCLNHAFISLFFFDYKTVSMILKLAHIENVKTIRKCNQHIL